MTKAMKTSPENRKCTYPDCSRTLSIYNHDTYCHIHRDLVRQDPKSQILIHMLPHQ